MLSSTKKKLGGAVAVSPRNVSPFIEHGVGVSLGMLRLAQNVFHGFNPGFREAVTLRIVRRRKFMIYVVLRAKRREWPMKLRAAIASNRGWPPESVEPVGKNGSNRTR